VRRATSSPLLRAAVIGALVAALTVLAGCGGGDSDPTTSASTGTGGTGNGDAGSASLRTFGEEAPPSDRAASGSAVQEFLSARADGNATKECSLMAASAKKTLAGFGGGLVENSQPCPELVQAITSQIQTKALEQPGPIRVIGMRVDGDRGFVLYRDQGGDEFAFAVIREGSAWKVGGLRGYPLP
jgi:hypothetical protein